MLKIKSLSCFVFTCNRGAVSQKSSKQTTTTNSTTKAEYVATFDTANEVVQMRKLITELGMVPSNSGAIAQAKEPRSHQKSKHIEKCSYIIIEIVGRGDVALQKIASTDNIVDPLAKAMSQQQLERHLEKMGLRYCSDWLQCKWEIVRDICPRAIFRIIFFVIKHSTRQ